MFRPVYRFWEVKRKYLQSEKYLVDVSRQKGKIQKTIQSTSFEKNNASVFVCFYQRAWVFGFYIIIPNPISAPHPILSK